MTPAKVEKWHAEQTAILQQANLEEVFVLPVEHPEFEDWFKAAPVPGEYDSMDALDQARWKGLLLDAYLAGRRSTLRLSR